MNIGDGGNPGGDLAGDFFADDVAGDSLEDIFRLGDGEEDMEELEGEALLALFFFFFLGVVGSGSGES